MKARISLLIVGICIVVYFESTAAATAKLQAQQGLRGTTSATTKFARVGELPKPEVPLRPVVDVTRVRDGEYAVDSARPLEQAAQFLERRLGVPIWYEDPVWEFDGDLVHAADLPQNRQLVERSPGWVGPLVPRGGLFTLLLPERPEQKPLDVITLAISSYRSSRLPGEFNVVTFGDNEFSIVGTGSASKDGVLRSNVSPLDRRISFPEAERNLVDTLNVICDAIQVKLLLTFSRSPETYRRVRIGANNTRARGLLASVMHSPGSTKVAWALDYMPDLHLYTLGLHPVEVEVTAPDGTSRPKTLVWPK